MLRSRLLFNCALSSASALALLVAGESAQAQQAAPDAAGAPKPAPAQKLAATPPGSAINLDTITVTVTKTEESVVDTMAGASVVTRRQIDQQIPSSISQMLENVPGVASQVTPNDPGQSISIRGLQDFGRVNVLVDGARQDYQISGHNANGSFYLSPEFIGQADVVRGPVSNIYGSGAIGGVVSFRTRSVEDILRPDEKFGIEQRTVLGTNGAGLVTSTSAGARAGTAADVYGQLVYRNSQSYRSGSGALVPDTGSDLLGGLFKINVRPTDGQQISAIAMTQKFDFANNGTSTDGARFRDNVTTGNYTLGYTLRPAGTPLIDFGAKVYYSTTQARQTFLAPDADGVYSALGVMPGAPLSDKIDTYGFDVHNTSRFVTGAFNHALTIGGDGVLDRVHTADDAGGYISVLTPSGQRTLSGGFVQDEVSYGGWLRALGAVRFDQYSLSGGGVSSSGNHVSPKLTIGVTPFQGFEIYGTYAEGYRAPSVTESLISGVHPFPAFTFLPNPDLIPEIAHNFEAGVNLKYNDVFRPGDTFRAKLTAFTNRVDNYIDIEQVGAPILTSFVPGFPNAACAGAPPGLCIPFQPFQYINVSKAQLDGVEAEGAYDWGGGVISMAASAVNGKNLVDGSTLATVAPYRASTTIALRFLSDKSLTVGARFTAVAASVSTLPSSATLPPSAGYGLVDLFGSYAYNDRVSGDVSVTNLFNKNYTPFLQSDASPGLTAKAGLTIRLSAK